MGLLCTRVVNRCGQEAKVLPFFGHCVFFRGLSPLLSGAELKVTHRANIKVSIGILFTGMRHWQIV